MFTDWLNSTLTTTRITTVKDPITHVAKQVPTTTAPISCRVGKSTGSVMQTDPQAVYTQSLKLYAPINADIKSGDIIKVYDVKNIIGIDLTTLACIKYVVGNPYVCCRHHLEVDVTLKQEV